MTEEEYDAFMQAVEDVKKRLYYYDPELPEDPNPFGVFD
jgi:hypothetical protein